MALKKRDSIEFEGNNTLYHYTSIYKAIEYIFPSNRLRLSPLIYSIDPMEHMAPNSNVSIYGYDKDEERLSSDYDGYKLSKMVSKYYKSLRQLCLCRNAEINFEGQYIGAFEPIEHFGFAKPRMWDQYGDEYKGICIALSRKSLEEQLPDDFRVIDIKYLKSSLFKSNIGKSSIKLNEVEKLGKEEYLNQMYESEINKISTKHNDYVDENECKIITSSEKEYEYIDISSCIQGIFVTNKLIPTYKTWLKDIASELKIPLIQVTIRRTGINTHTLQN